MEAVTTHPAIGDVELGGPGGVRGKACSDEIGQVDEERHVTAYNGSSRRLLRTAAVAVDVAVQETIERRLIVQDHPRKPLPQVMCVTADVLANQLGEVGRDDPHPPTSYLALSISRRP